MTVVPPSLTMARPLGLSVLLVDLREAIGHGITVKPIRAMMNHHSCELFIDDLEVPAENLVDEEGTIVLLPSTSQSTIRWSSSEADERDVSILGANSPGMAVPGSCFLGILPAWEPTIFSPALSASPVGAAVKVRSFASSTSGAASDNRPFSASAATRSSGPRFTTPSTLSKPTRVLAAVAVAASAFSIWSLMHDGQPKDPRVWHSAIPLPHGEAVRLTGNGSSLAISPDARWVAHVSPRAQSMQQLYVQKMDGSAQLVAGAVGARLPVFSADSQWLGYWDLAGGKLMKVSVAGSNPGPPITIAETKDGRGMSWGPDRWIVCHSSSTMKWYSDRRSFCMKISSECVSRMVAR